MLAVALMLAVIGGLHTVNLLLAQLVQIEKDAAKGQ